MQTVLNDISNSIRKTVLRIKILSLKPHIYYTEVFYSSSETLLFLSLDSYFNI